MKYKNVQLNANDPTFSVCNDNTSAGQNHISRASKKNKNK